MNIFAAGYNHVVHAAAQFEVAVRSPHHDVARPVPASGQFLGGRGRLFEIAKEGSIRTSIDQQLPLFSDFAYLVHTAADPPDADAGIEPGAVLQRFTDRVRHEGIHHFGRAIDVRNPCVEKLASPGRATARALPRPHKQGIDGFHISRSNWGPPTLRESGQARRKQRLCRDH